MNNNRRITLNTNKNIVVEFTDERIIPAGGLAVVGAILGKSDFIKKLNRMDVTANRSQHQIKNGDIVLFTTSAKGLDVSHMGIIVVERNRVCLLHASSKSRTVILEQQPLYNYVSSNKAITGIRVVRL